MGNRNMRMRKYNAKTNGFDVLFPQTVTENILRQEDRGVLEDDLLQYDHHLSSKGDHFNRAVSSGTGRVLSVTLKDAVLTDGFPLLLTLHCDLECEPTLSFNGGEPAYIVSGNGSNIPGGQAEGTILFLVWSERLTKWVLMNSFGFQDVTKVLLPVESEFVYVGRKVNDRTIVIPGFDKNIDKITLNYGQTILRPGIDYRFDVRSNNTILLQGFGLEKDDQLFCIITKYVSTAKRGQLKYELERTDYKVTIDVDDTDTVIVPPEAQDCNHLQINYNQTILRNNLDFDWAEDGTAIILKTIRLARDEVVIFTATRFIESNAEMLPNNWGATGNYRYSMNVIHTAYEAVQDNVTVIPVPQFNHKKDDIWPILDNKLLIYDEDYTIDEIGQVVLLKTRLNRNETLYFTILQGAMMDVPNFNVIRASGDSGQHILLNMSYSALCNYYTLMIQLTHDLETNPTLKCVDGPAEPVCDCYGNPIFGGYKAGSYLWVVYNYDRKCWYSLGHGQMDITSLMPTFNNTKGSGNYPGGAIGGDGKYIETVIPHGLASMPAKIEIQPCEPPTVKEDGTQTTIGDVWFYADDRYLYVGNTGESTSGFNWFASTEDQNSDLRTYIDQQLTAIRNSPGKVETRLVVFTADEDGITTIEHIEDFDHRFDKLIVNFGQTMLRPEIDYLVTDEDGIELIGIELNTDDIVQFTIIKQT